MGGGSGKQVYARVRLGVISLLKTFEDGLENFAVGNCVGIIELVVYGSLLVNVKTFNGIEDAFCLEL